VWGPTAERQVASPDYWKKPLMWNKTALANGKRARVFCASMSDVFENRPALQDARLRLWELIEATTMLDWLILTKRPENINAMVPWGTFLKPWPRHVWLGVSAENQQYAEQRIPVLLDIPARVRFVSYEPALGPITWDDRWTGLHWVIVGGESGPDHRRNFDMTWARSARDWCQARQIAFFFKQANGYRAGSAPWLVEADGSRRRYQQFPGNLMPPICLDNDSAPIHHDPQQLGLWQAVRDE